MKDLTSGRWWRDDKKTVHHSVVSVFQQIDARQISILSRYAYLLSMYEGKIITSMDGYMIETSSPDIYDEESKENIVRPAVDSLVAKISTNSPRLVTQTNGADWELRQKAKDRTLLAEGVINDQKGYKLGRQIFKDGCIWDLGALKVYPDYEQQRVIYERLIPHEIVVDPYDARYGNPRSLYTIKIIHKDVLKDIYPKKADDIENAGWIRDYVKHSSPTEDMCGVIECWHLPSGPNAKDGRHIVCTDRGTLLDERWERDTFPIVIWRWKTRQYGWRGFGAVEDIENYQKQLDFLDEKINKLLNNMGYRMGVEEGSKVNTDELSNETDAIPVFTYRGEKPQVIPDPDPPAALFAERERKKQAAFEQLGISLLLAQSKKPTGLDSGVALREYKDTESERFKDVGQAWEEWYIEVGEQTMLALEDLHTRVPNCVVRVPVGGNLSEIKLSDVEWQKNRYMIAIRPAGILPREPAGRLQTINELIQTFPEAQRVLASKMQNPDVDDAMSLVSAPVDAVNRDIEIMLDGNPVTPEPFLDLELAKSMVLQSYQKLKAMKNVPEAIMQYHRDYLTECDSILKQQVAKMQAMIAAQQNQMGGMPGQPPGPMPGPAGPPPLPPGGQ